MSKATGFLRLFRWAGLIPFVVIVGGLWVGGYLFADAIARSLLQSNLTRIQGAQVDVGSVDVAWQPFGLVAEQLEFTDPNQPTHNALDIGQVALQLDFLALLTGKVLIESLAVDELQFQTERSSLGRVVTRAPRPERDGPSVTERVVDTVDLPSPRDALERHGPLETEARAQAARAARDSAVSDVQTRSEALPDDRTLEEHRERLQRLQNQELRSLEAIQQVRTEVTDLTSAVARDRMAIDRFIDSVESGEQDIRGALQALVGGPGADVNAILSTYNLSSDGQVALAGLLLGEQWAGWIEDGQRWYATATPWIQRLQDRRRERESVPTGVQGYFVLFPEDNPIPRFWLREARISAQTAGGDWSGRIVDLSSDHALIDRPATLEARSTRLDAAEAAALDLVWDRRVDNQLDVRFDVDRWRVSGWQIDDDDLPIGLRSANTDLRVNATWRNGWSGGMNWQFGDARFGMPAEWRSGNVLRQALEGVNRFAVQTELSGSSVVPRTSWSSDLDNQLASALRDIVGAQFAEWEGELRAELEQRREELEAPVRAELARLEDQRREWEQKRNDLETEVVETLASFERQLTEERRTIERRADEERRAAEERARQEAQEAERRAREELENRARDALRGGGGLGF
ncbi:MAG: TIGR03545 family protein [Natronospirillum sp.]|uniref:TIGR03545 family protein n=1 Tax=Natronospirillum sp. TaxID=2812955 RepID=UPI0025EF1329|nr:TIGR03545 family protein [Natronospirillum sp.]MCH8552856.1 TIGR03545 family protein [Natronospirillum sp.]